MSDRDAVNIGELINKGEVLHTSEAIALIYEACSRAGENHESTRFPQVPSDLWLMRTGELHVVLSDPDSATEDVRLAAAALLDALLPPESERPEHHVPAAVRSLAGRLRESATTPVESIHRLDLLWILKRHLPQGSFSVLQELIVRVNREGREADERSRSMAPLGRAPTAAPVPVPLSRSTPAVPSRPTQPPRTESSPQPARERDFDVFRFEPADAPIPRPVRAHPRRAVQAALAIVFITASAYGGYTYTRWLGSTKGQTPVDGAFAEPQRRMGAGQPRASDAGPPVTQLPDGPAATDHLPRETAVAATVGDEDDVRPLALPVSGGAFSPSFAPSGRALLFHAGRTTGRLLEADLDDRGTAVRITPVLAAAPGNNASNDSHVRLSPDGRLIAFDSDRDGLRGVYMGSVGDSKVQRVSGSGFATVPSWSPDMKWLAFARAEPTQPKVWNLWLRDLRAGTLTRLTSFRVGQTWGASWFADSRRLCYSHETQLIIFHLDTGASETFDSPRPGHLVRTPAVSPDNDRIVFQVHRDGVWMLDLQTASMRRILSDATAEEFAWDPNGRRVAFHSRRDGQWRIWTTTPPRS